MTWTTGPRNSASSGFTLMELVLVLVVISVVLALSAPTLRGFFASRQTADAAAAVLSLTQWASSEAITQGHRCRLNVDPSAGTCWLTVEQMGAFVEPNWGAGRHWRLPDGAAISLHADPADPLRSYVQFYPTGRSDVATLEIRGRGGEVFLVACPSATERFRVLSLSEAQ